jgi:hypothetical protein
MPTAARAPARNQTVPLDLLQPPIADPIADVRIAAAHPAALRRESTRGRRWLIRRASMPARPGRRWPLVGRSTSERAVVVGQRQLVAERDFGVGARFAGGA